MSSSSTQPKRIRLERGLYQRPADGAYEFIRSVDGKQRQTTLKAKNLTEARKEMQRLAVADGNGETVVSSRITLREAAEEDLRILASEVAAGEKSPRTLERYQGDLE